MDKITVSSNTHTLVGIEFFRGIAALLVVIYHISRHYEQNFAEFPFSGITEFGHSGVDFFFTLSGFIILYVHHNDINCNNRFLPYIFKRFARLYPFYWFVIFLSLLLIPFVSSREFPQMGELIKDILLWPQGMDGLIVGVSWTLQHEIIFYILFSVLILNKYVGSTILFLWFCAIVLTNYIVPIAIDVPVIFSAFNTQFFMGMFAALVLIRWDISWHRILLYAGFFGFVATASLEIQGVIDGFGKYARIYYGLSSTFLIIGCVAYERNFGLKIPWVGRIIGRSSYSIYLTHLFFNGIVFKLLTIVGIVGSFPYWASASIDILIVITAACIISTWVELPLTKFVRNLLLRR